MINAVIEKQANENRVQTLPTVQMKMDFLQEKLKKRVTDYEMMLLYLFY